MHGGIIPLDIKLNGFNFSVNNRHSIFQSVPVKLEDCYFALNKQYKEKHFSQLFTM